MPWDLGMETPPSLQVYDLGHLGLVASVLDRIRLVETVDRLVGPRPGVVLDGAGYSRENLRALEGFSWILRVPATLKEARALLEGEFPREAWTPLLPGYRGLEVEADYGGVRQRWLLVESEEALSIVLSHATTPETQSQALEALRFKCQVLWALLDAVERAYG